MGICVNYVSKPYLANTCLAQQLSSSGESHSSLKVLENTKHVCKLYFIFILWYEAFREMGEVTEVVICLWGKNILKAVCFIYRSLGTQCENGDVNIQIHEIKN